MAFDAGKKQDDSAAAGLGADGPVPGKKTLIETLPPPAAGFGADQSSWANPVRVRVTARGLNVRAGASADTAVLGALHRHDEVDTIGRDGVWLMLLFHGQPAFIHSEWVEKLAAAPLAPAPHVDASAPPPPAPPKDVAVHVKPPPPAPPAKIEKPEEPELPWWMPKEDAHVAPPPPVHPTAPPPAPTAAPPTPAPPTPAPAGGAEKAPAHEDVKPPPNPNVLQHVYVASAGKNAQKVAVFVSPGGLTATPDIFLFLHGHDAQFHIDADQEKKTGVMSGLDVAAEATAHATGKNVVAILPQGVIGGAGKDEGGNMHALSDGLPAFLKQVLTSLAADVQMKELSPGRISIAGHSAGGYLGINQSLGHAGALADQITDITLMDTDYAGSHFATVEKWLFAGKPGKSLRITESAGQLEQGVTGTKRGKWSGAVPTFGHDALVAKAKAHGMTVDFLDVSKENHGKHNTGVLHAHVKKDSAIHADVLILKADQGHHQIRDEVMDDAILSIGEGAAGADTFGQKDVAGQGEKSLTELRAQQHLKKKPEEGEKQHPAAAAQNALVDKKPEEKKPKAVDPQVPEAKKEGKPEGAKGDGVHEAPPTSAELTAEKDPELTAFKRKVYDHNLQINKTRKLTFLHGVPHTDLKEFGEGDKYKLREESADAAKNLLSTMRAALKQQQAAGNEHALRVKAMTVSSAYRDIDKDFGLWDTYFMGYFNEMYKELAKMPGGVYGDAAVNALGHHIAIYKALPGYSNHTAGRALDIVTTEVDPKTNKPVHYGTSHKQFDAWRETWMRQWLEANAPGMGWHPYAAEMWHWDHKP